MLNYREELVQDFVNYCLEVYEDDENLKEVSRELWTAVGIFLDLSLGENFYGDDSLNREMGAMLLMADTDPMALRRKFKDFVQV